VMLPFVLLVQPELKPDQQYGSYPSSELLSFYIGKL
jgi:hypothetical protein